MEDEHGNADGGCELYTADGGCELYTADGGCELRHGLRHIKMTILFSTHLPTVVVALWCVSLEQKLESRIRHLAFDEHSFERLTILCDVLS